MCTQESNLDYMCLKKSVLFLEFLRKLLGCHLSCTLLQHPLPLLFSRPVPHRPACNSVIAIHTMWLFGYGSLIWKIDFEYERKVPGLLFLVKCSSMSKQLPALTNATNLAYIEGYVRRFWQGSHDHRGTPENPGRVVSCFRYNAWKTMDDIHPATSAERCYGMAFKIHEKDAENVRKHLDFREKNGYSIDHVRVLCPETDQVIAIDALLYVATHDNEAFLGPAPLNDMAAQILTSRGPSGANVEYLLELCAALRDLYPTVNDIHLNDLEREVRHMMGKETVQKMDSKVGDVFRMRIKSESLQDIDVQFEHLIMDDEVQWAEHQRIGTETPPL